VWLEPLHVDEAVTIEFAPRSLSAIVSDVFVDRGGSPVFFFVEHGSLWWPGGVTGLRLPAFLFFLAALAFSFLVGRELCGRRAAVLLPPLLAAAPLAVRLSTFARMYTLFLAAVLLAFWLLLRAESEDGRRRWIAAGSVTGGLVYVHPIAPLYIVVAYAATYLHANEEARGFLRRARVALVASAIVAVPYLYALVVLSRRYDVASGSRIFETATGRAIPVESLLALSSRAWLGAAVLVALALAGLVRTTRRSRRDGLAIALWVVVPVAFFSLIPSETSFYPRYLLPALPFFLLLTAVGCLELGRLAGRAMLVAATLVLAIAAWETMESVSRVDRLRDIRLVDLTNTVDQTGDAVIFSSIGSPVAGRPAELLDGYVAIELPETARLEELPGEDPRHEENLRERGVAAVRDFLASEARTKRGVWIFTGSPRGLHLAAKRFESDPGLVTVRVSPHVLVVRSRRPLDARSLIAQAVRVRTVWRGAGSGDRWSQFLAGIGREALRTRP
jgi:Dolichyl-phosphate-mannose-protein mannosyltransferase